MKKLYLFLLTATMSISTMAHNPLTDRSMFNFHWDMFTVKNNTMLVVIYIRRIL